MTSMKRHKTSVSRIFVSMPNSGVTDGGKGGEPPPWQAKCKN